MPDLPDWLDSPDPEIYSLTTSYSGEPTIIRHTLSHTTPTQIVTSRGGLTYRWSRTSFLAMGRGSAAELVSATHPKVREAHAREATSAAMAALRRFLEEVQVGAKIYNNDPATAYQQAALIRDLAAKAAEDITTARVALGEKAVRAGETS